MMTPWTLGDEAAWSAIVPCLCSYASPHAFHPPFPRTGTTHYHHAPPPPPTDHRPHHDIFLLKDDAPPLPQPAPGPGAATHPHTVEHFPFLLLVPASQRAQRPARPKRGSRRRRNPGRRPGGGLVALDGVLSVLHVLGVDARGRGQGYVSFELDSLSSLFCCPRSSPG